MVPLKTKLGSTLIVASCCRTVILIVWFRAFESLLIHLGALKLA